MSHDGRERHIAVANNSVAIGVTTDIAQVLNASVVNDPTLPLTDEFCGDARCPVVLKPQQPTIVQAAKLTQLRLGSDKVD
jgi:hypothetical protein